MLRRRPALRGPPLIVLLIDPVPLAVSGFIILLLGRGAPVRLIPGWLVCFGISFRVIGLGWGVVYWL